MLMKQIIDTVPRNVKIVRLHELERAPDIFIRVSYLRLLAFEIGGLSLYLFTVVRHVHAH